MGFPAVATVAPGVADPLLLTIAVLLFSLVLGQLKGLTWPVLWLSMLVTIYALSSQFGENRAQGLRHTLTLVALSAMFLAFATYGSAVLSLRWFRVAAAVTLTADVVIVSAGGFPKNTAGGALIYVFALAITAVLARKGSSGWIGALAFAVVGIAISYILNFRFLLIGSLVFLVCFGFTTVFKTRGYWLFGLVGASASVGAVLWFFLSLNRAGLAWDLGQRIRTLTGHRANTGRETIWVYVLNAVQDKPLLGLGAGVLPRDVMRTEFSAHSYYLQIFLQTGALGVILVMGFLVSIWSILAKAKSAAGRFGSAVFIMVVVHNATEVLMFQNNALVAAPAWCCIGLAIAAERSPANAKDVH
jgi:O-antigen ligase